MNSNDNRIAWNTDTNSMKDKDICTQSSIEVQTEIDLSANESQTLGYDYSWATIFLIDDVIKTGKNFHVEEQHQLKFLIQK
jgi:hypothetical protein